ncbi:uncharacterized protein K02A2.6-like [Ornithodoros turicata]|uniref:uncharacterized protein K02A2.6-like n=1 Tax=Ornithodoros turicata TaxID=34597 RepID=UPI00313980C0
MCRSQAVSVQAREVVELQATKDEALCVLEVDTPRKTTIEVDVDVEGSRLNLLIDTGSSVSILKREDFLRMGEHTTSLRSASVNLLDYSRNKIELLGCTVKNVHYNGKEAPIVFYVVEKGTSLLGLDALMALHLTIEGSTLQCLQTQITTTSREDIQKDFPELFSPGLGLAKGFVHRIKVREDATLVRAKYRPMPEVVESEIDAEVQRLLDMDVIEPVDAPEWVSNGVAVRKRSGSIQLCVDLRQPNAAITADCFPLPNMASIVDEMAGAVYFSKLDLRSAYHQVMLHEDSRNMTAFITRG